MATGGMRVLLSLPIFIALLVYGLSQLVPFGEATPYIGTDPGQIAHTFLTALYRCDGETAATMLHAKVPSGDLITIGGQLQENYGPTVISSADVIASDMDNATVWSDTITSFSNQYIINWPLQRVNDRWFISGYGSLHDMLADQHGLEKF